MDNLIDKRLDGRYLIKEIIGNGGMANVYKALDMKENRLVAVKVLREDCMNNEDLVRRFKNESKAIAVLDNPYIVKVFDVSVSDKLQFIVMEYIDGITLKDYMEYRKEPLTYKETLHFVAQTLSALQHAHEKGIVHRDIKPQNIMLLADGNIKVMDFGIARFSRSENQTMTDKAIGSVHYISPEQAKGDTTDSKADIYSVGVMMYEMLSGRLPFESDSPVSVAIKQISDTAVPLRSINPAVPEALEAITKKAMAKEARERYQSAGAMMADIEVFKRNPSVKFEYQYLTDTTPTRYIDKVVNKTDSKRSTQTSRGRQNTAKPATRGAARPATKARKQSRYTLPVLAGMALAFAIGATILVFLIFKMSGNPLFTKRADVELPNFNGMTEDQIRANPDYAGFNLEFVQEFNDDPKYPAGTVFAQNPKPPKTVKEGARVTLRISKGQEMVFIPDVVGWEKDKAIEKLKEVGLSTMIKPVPTSEVAIGKVVSTDGVAGAQVATGTTVYVYVSEEERPTVTTIPDCMGLTSVEAAKALLDGAQLVVGSLTTVENEAPAGTILGQDPLPNTPADIWSSVHLQVSSGHQHHFDRIEILTPATCAQKGKRKVSCTCGEAHEEEYDADLNDKAVHTALDPITGTCATCATHKDEWITQKPESKPDDKPHS